MRQNMREYPILFLGYTESVSRSDAELLESDLLIRFENEHGELPPFNKQRQLARIWTQRS